MGTEKQYATAQGEPHNFVATEAERQLTALLEAMAQYFAEPNIFRTEIVCRGRFKTVHSLSENDGETKALREKQRSKTKPHPKPNQ